MNKQNKNSGRPFRFPFDIDRRYFLLLAAIFFILAIKPINTYLMPRINPQNIEKRINKHFNKQLKEFNTTTDRLNEKNINFNSISKQSLQKYNDKSWSFLVYKNDSLIFWNKPVNKTISSLKSKDSIITYEDQNEIGLYIKRNKIINGTTYKIIGKFPAFKSYNSENDFFKSYFSFLEPSTELYDFGYKLVPFTVNVPGRHVINIKDQPRFELQEKNNFLEQTDKNFWHFFLAAIPFVMFGVSIHTYFKVSVKNNPPLYFTLLLFTVFVIRGLGYAFNFPDTFNEFHLFNPSLYASSGLNLSLGDVFINACLLFWILFFYIMNVQNKVFAIKKIPVKIAFITICSVLIYFFANYSLSNIYSIINDGLLNFDTTNYHNIRPETIIGLGTLLLTFMNFVLVLVIFNRYFERYFKNSIIKFFIPLIGLLFANIFLEKELLTVMTIACIWSSITLYFLSAKFFSTKFDFNSYKLIYWLIYLAATCVLVIYYFDSNKEIKLRQNFAESLIHFENKSTEDDLLELGEQIKNDTLISSFNSKDGLHNYLENNYFIRFEAEYVAKSKVYNLTSDSVAANESIIYAQFDSKAINKNNPLILLKNRAGEEEYIFSITKNDFFISLNLSPSYNLNYTSGDKFIDEINSTREKFSPLYKFGYYLNDQLVQQSSIDDFPLVLPKKASSKTGQVSLDNNWNSNAVIVHTKMNADKRSVVIRQKSNVIYKLSTTYAYVFTSIFILMTLYILGNIMARSNLRRKRFVNLLGLTLRMRIHLSILLVELISLTIIGIITILVLTNSAKTNAFNKAARASLELKNAIQEAEITNKFILNTHDSISIDVLESVIDPYLEKHEVGVNLYNLNGVKIYSTISKKISSVLPNLINPQAFAQLRLKRNISTLQEEKIGNLEYYSIYSNIRNKNGKLTGILEIPNYSSKQTIKQNNSRIVTMLINIYAFVFLLSSLFAFYITKRLTMSFTKIVNQFSKINLTETNQPLQWPYSDEIGLLIKEYNRTLVKLENSTALLAKSERELAWREMARQIAHEIKNPLTPMSLSLQSLQAAIKRNDPNVPQLTEKVTKTVLEQIKVLARTASNFSEFATMTDIEARKESLLDILESTTGIYSDSNDAEFLFVLPKADIKVNVDKVKVIRVLTNIIQNSIQAIPEDRVGQIMLTVTKQAQNFVDVAIQDNGIGIPEEFYSKVFEPNFTTKSSGSGLGLAMCKDIMTKTGGNIYFESVVGDGSTFHILIPIYKEDQS